MSLKCFRILLPGMIPKLLLKPLRGRGSKTSPAESQTMDIYSWFSTFGFCKDLSQEDMFNASVFEVSTSAWILCWRNSKGASARTQVSSFRGSNSKQHFKPRSSKFKPRTKNMNLQGEPPGHNTSKIRHLCECNLRTLLEGEALSPPTSLSRATPRPVQYAKTL